MCGGSILSCCPRNHHGHEQALKEEEEDQCKDLSHLVSSIRIIPPFVSILTAIPSQPIARMKSVEHFKSSKKSQIAFVMHLEVPLIN